MPLFSIEILSGLCHMFFQIKHVINLKGFLPRDTAKHHQGCVLQVLREALDEANITPEQIDGVAYTKGQK